MLFISPLHDLFELICKFPISENLRGGGEREREEDRKEIAPSSKSVKPQLLL